MFAMPPMFTTTRCSRAWPNAPSVKRGHERRALAAERNVEPAKVCDRRDAGHRGDHVRIAELEAERLGAERLVVDRLPVAADRRDVFGAHAARGDAIGARIRRRIALPRRRERRARAARSAASRRACANACADPLGNGVVFAPTIRKRSSPISANTASTPSMLVPEIMPRKSSLIAGRCGRDSRPRLRARLAPLSPLPPSKCRWNRGRAAARAWPWST